MSGAHRIDKKNEGQPARGREPGSTKSQADGSAGEGFALDDLQKRLGNRAVQRLLAQRSGEGAFELDDDTAGKIDRERGAGQSLDSAVQREMGAKMGHDFSGVRVHTSRESDALNQKLNATAFTTGKDIFFRSDAFDTQSPKGRELLAHELTHVVQQSTGKVKGGDRMRVNAAGDSFEQEADAVASSLASPAGERAAQRQEELPEEEIQERRAAQRQEELPEEEIQERRAAQRQEMQEEVQMQMDEEEEEEPAQRQEEDELQLRREGHGAAQRGWEDHPAHEPQRAHLGGGQGGEAVDEHQARRHGSESQSGSR